MRLLFAAAIALLALPGIPAAQTLAPLPRITAPLPSIGLPLARITPTLPSIGLPPLDARGTVPHSPGPHVGDGHARRGPRHRGHARPAAILVVPYAWDPYYSYSLNRSATDAPSSKYGSPRPGPSARTTGTLQLDVHPAALVQVFVDGLFVGMPSDFDGDLELEAGTHRVELRAPGYQSAVFDVLITAGRPVTYRRSLEPQPAASSAPAVKPPAAAPSAPAASGPVARSTIYVIPGCYIGNVPPEDAGLPDTCDPSRVVTFEP